jgi:hypothetical protein
VNTDHNRSSTSAASPGRSKRQGREPVLHAALSNYGRMRTRILNAGETRLNVVSPKTLYVKYTSHAKSNRKTECRRPVRIAPAAVKHGHTGARSDARSRSLALGSLARSSSARRTTTTRRGRVLAHPRVCLHQDPWLILPVVICLSQRLSHACLSACRIKVKPRMAH